MPTEGWASYGIQGEAENFGAIRESSVLLGAVGFHRAQVKAAGLPRAPPCSLLTKRAVIFTLGDNVKEEGAGCSLPS